VSEMTRCLRAVVAAAAAALLAAGCASMPTSSAVHVGRVVPAPGGLSDLDVRVFPPSWHAGLDPAGVVGGFLRAVVNDDDDYAIARSYLTPDATRNWKSEAGLTTYDDSAVRVSASGNRVLLVAPRLGRIDARGGYEPAPGKVSVTFTMSHSGGVWRIDHLPAGVLLGASDAQRDFRLADVYYLNRAGTTLVPDQVLLRDSPRGIATALMAALLSGPGPWLGPAVHSAAPRGTTLVGTVPIHDDGVADVNLSASVRSLSPDQLRALAAQVAWTLRQVYGVTAVRLLTDSAPLAISGLPTRQSVTGWPSYDPAAAPVPHGLVYVAGGQLRATGADAAAVRRSDPGNAVSAARSRDGQTLAVVQRIGGVDRLLVGPTGRRLVPRLSAATMTPPTFDGSNRVLTVVTGPGGRHVVAIDAVGREQKVAAAGDLLSQPVSALQISRDGARVAAVVGRGRLLIGRVATGRGGIDAIGGVRPIAGALTGVRGVAWSGADTVMVTAAGGRGRELVETDVDGYAVRAVDIAAVQGSVIGVAAGPRLPVTVATSDGELWVHDNGWRPLASGTAAAYAG
jgi:hypothetical protein